VAIHTRCSEPHCRVVDLKHYEGLWRPADTYLQPGTAGASPLADMGRSLDDYAAIVEGRTS